MREKPSGSYINWSNMARKYKLTCNDKLPQNGGQVMFEFAKKNNINVYQFNTTLRVANRDYVRRIRRAKKKL